MGNVWEEHDRWSHERFFVFFSSLLLFYCCVRQSLQAASAPSTQEETPHSLVKKGVFHPEGQEGISLYLQIVRLKKKKEKKKETQPAGKREGLR